MNTENMIPFVYVMAATALGANANSTFTLTMAPDSDFELSYLLGTCTEDADTDFMPNNFSCLITDVGTGRQLANARVPQRNLVGPSNGTLYQRRPIIFGAQTVLSFDILNLTANSNTVTICLYGYKHLVGAKG